MTGLPSTRARIAAVFGERLVEIDEWRDARSAIVPMLRGATYGLEAALANPDARVLGRPFLPFLEVFAVVDHPTTMAYVTQPSMDRWSVTAAEVRAAADATLATSMQGEMSKYDDTHGPLWIGGASANVAPHTASALDGTTCSLEGRIPAEVWARYENLLDAYQESQHAKQEADQHDSDVHQAEMDRTTIDKAPPRSGDQ